MQIICEQTRESSLAISHAIGYNNKAKHRDCLYMDRYRSGERADAPPVAEEARRASGSGRNSASESEQGISGTATGHNGPALNRVPTAPALN